MVIFFTWLLSGFLTGIIYWLYIQKDNHEIILRIEDLIIIAVITIGGYISAYFGVILIIVHFCARFARFLVKRYSKTLKYVVFSREKS